MIQIGMKNSMNSSYIWILTFSQGGKLAIYLTFYSDI